MMNRLLLILISLSFAIPSMGQSDCIGEKGKLEWLIFDKSSKDVSLNPNYPNNPDGVEIIRALETEIDFDDNYASIVRGFICPSETGTYLLNVTGRDRVEFYLSTNDEPENLSLFISTSNTNYSQYEAQESQTDTVYFAEGNYYYFELQHSENTGSEHARVSWKTPGNPDVWTTIGEDFVYGYNCENTCGLKGDACDDGNVLTENDVFDGDCNCFGTPVEKPDCVGEKGLVQVLYYDGIEGSNITDLTNNYSFPLKPSRAETISILHMPLQSSYDYFGSAVKAYLYIPISGEYEFAAIGNTRTEIYLSKTGDISDLILVANSSGLTTSMQLEAGQWCYLKLLHKENINSEEFAATWRTPFYKDSVFKYIDGAYLYNYACELACMPEGTPCDDGDNETINDEYDENCQCVGVYCPDGDCPESKSFAHYDACEMTDMHSNFIDDSWLSCQPTESMNAEREAGHWIQYDLGSVMPIGHSHFWNYNVAGETGKGFKTVAIDLSYDGLVWNHFATMEWPQASGTNDYHGFEGPDFTGESAQYILITALDNWDASSCAGFSEATFNVASCPDLGTACNDNDENTVNDQYDADCICKGEAITSTNISSLVNAIKIYPNPAKTWTSIVFYLPEDTSLDLKVYDLNGRLVMSIANNETFSQGLHQKLLSVQNLSAGNYVVKLESGLLELSESLLVVN